MKSRSIIPAVVGLAAAKPILYGRQIPADFGPFTFTSTYNMIATPDRVVNGTNPPASTPGETGAMGMYNYGINSQLDMICYNITLMGVTGPFSSPAVTATHIHEAGDGLNGPPRIAFPNPEPQDSGPEVIKRSQGCIQGPFTTGILAEGVDTGTGFTVAQIEANPAGFFTDSHTALFVPGVVRAQMQANAPGVAPGVGAAQPAAPAPIPEQVAAPGVPAPAPSPGAALPAPAPGAAQPAPVVAPIAGLEACQGIVNGQGTGIAVTGCNRKFKKM